MTRRDCNGRFSSHFQDPSAGKIPAASMEQEEGNCARVWLPDSHGAATMFEPGAYGPNIVAVATGTEAVIGESLALIGFNGPRRHAKECRQSALVKQHAFVRIIGASSRRIHDRSLTEAISATPTPGWPSAGRVVRRWWERWVGWCSESHQKSSQAVSSVGNAPAIGAGEPGGGWIWNHRPPSARRTNSA